MAGQQCHRLRGCLMLNVSEYYVGLRVTAPSHLEGARVTAAWLEEDGPEWNRDLLLTLDRKHPTEPGFIGVVLDDVNLEQAVA